MSLTVMIPVKTVSESSNGTQGPLWAKSKRKKEQHAIVAAWLATLDGMLPEDPFPMVVTIVRYSVKTMDDDALRSSIKYCRDGIAKWLGVDDGNVARVQYQYGQAKGKRGEYKLSVTFRPRMRLEERLVAV